MEQRRNTRAGKREIPEKNSLTSGIVLHDSHMRKSGGNSAGNRTRFALVGGETNAIAIPLSNVDVPGTIDGVPHDASRSKTNIAVVSVSIVQPYSNIDERFLSIPANAVRAPQTARSFWTWFHALLPYISSRSRGGNAYTTLECSNGFHVPIRSMPLVGGFSRGFPVCPTFHSGTAPYSPRSPSSALKTSLIQVAEISSLIRQGIPAELLRRVQEGSEQGQAVAIATRHPRAPAAETSSKGNERRHPPLVFPVAQASSSRSRVLLTVHKHIVKKWSEALSASKQTPPGRPSARDINTGNPANEVFVIMTLHQQHVQRWARVVRRHASNLQPTSSWTRSHVDDADSKSRCTELIAAQVRSRGIRSQHRYVLAHNNLSCRTRETSHELSSSCNSADKWNTVRSKWKGYAVSSPLTYRSVSKNRVLEIPHFLLPACGVFGCCGVHYLREVRSNLPFAPPAFTGARRGLLKIQVVSASFLGLWHSSENNMPIAAGFSHVGNVKYEAADRWDFLGISRFPRPYIQTLLHTHLTATSSALKTLMLRKDCERLTGRLRKIDREIGKVCKRLRKIDGNIDACVADCGADCSACHVDGIKVTDVRSRGKWPPGDPELCSMNRSDTPRSHDFVPNFSIFYYSPILAFRIYSILTSFRPYLLSIPRFKVLEAVHDKGKIPCAEETVWSGTNPRKRIVPRRAYQARDALVEFAVVRRFRPLTTTSREKLATIPAT
ncbi:hypothetical protein PR048_002648 [Dryococelus australis]|uniref:Uncharacterized protein n=1 Tax=Dryococelus australis TaxID=614101 RepID=A0ABQ9IKU2_9NEOP|nr:hypothetical protein PR048_002648 [Dryococelus australis]